MRTDHRRGIWSLAAFLFCALAFTPAYLLRHDLAVTGDDASYLSHAMTLGLDLDLDYQNEIAWRNVTFKSADGNMLSHPIGSGILAAPFVAIFSLVDRATKHPVIGDHLKYLYSWSYFGFLVAASAYFLLGLVLLYRSVVRFVPRVGPGLFVTMILSTGIFYYVLGRFTMSHGFEFFVIAGLVYTSIKLSEATETRRSRDFWAWALATAAVAAMCLWVRYNNWNVLFVPLLVSALRGLFTGSGLLSAKQFLQWGLLTALAFVPFFLFSSYYFHSLVPSLESVYANTPEAQVGTSHLIERLFGLLPGVFPILFGSEYGLVYTLPVVVLGIPTLVVLALRRGVAPGRRWVAGLVVVLLGCYVGFDFAIVLIWQSTASVYGFRYLFPLIPFGILGTAYLWESVITSRLPAIAGVILKGLIVALLVFGILNAAFYRTNPALSNRPQINVFGKFHRSSANGYELRLLEEMQKPGTWLQLVGKGGVSLFVPVELYRERWVRELIPGDYLERYLKLFEAVPFAVRLQGLTLLFLWLGGGYWLSRRLSAPNHREPT